MRHTGGTAVGAGGGEAAAGMFFAPQASRGSRRGW